MTTRELIEKLQKLDPEGNIPVCNQDNESIVWVEAKPAYWDGRLEVIEWEGAKPIRGSIVTTGNKIVITSLSLFDALSYNIDGFELNAPGWGPEYIEKFEMSREALRDEKYNHCKDSFIRHMIRKIEKDYLHAEKSYLRNDLGDFFTKHSDKIINHNVYYWEEHCQVLFDGLEFKFEWKS